MRIRSWLAPLAVDSGRWGRFAAAQGGITDDHSEQRRDMPQLGFGVFQVPPAETAEAVTTALDAGYRSIDTAAIYGNEAGRRPGARRLRLPRDELFVTTKLWNADQGYDAHARGLRRQPGQAGPRLRRPVPDPLAAAPRATATSRPGKALEKLLRRRPRPRHRRLQLPARAPGAAARRDRIVPAVNQIELHPQLQQARAARRTTRSTASRPRRGARSRQGAPARAIRALAAIAEKHGKTPAQVVLRWHLQLGNVVIPKSVTPARIRENIDVFDFELTEDIAAIAALDGHRIGPDPDTFG